MELSVSVLKKFFSDLAGDVGAVWALSPSRRTLGPKVYSIALRVFGVLFSYFALSSFCEGFRSFGGVSLAFSVGLGCLAHDLIRTGLNMRENRGVLRFNAALNWFDGTCVFRYFSHGSS